MVQAATRHGYRVCAPSRQECNLLEPECIEKVLRDVAADIVINCAAISGLEACADDAEAASLVNCIAPSVMARSCRLTGGHFVHLSTDYVLDGSTSGLKGESAPCKPCCVYGESKFRAELGIAEANAQSLILRVSWLCGNPLRPGFAESIAMKALAGQHLAAIADKFSLPTDVEELAEASLLLAEGRQGGLLHVCSTGAPISWHRYAELAVQALVEEGALPRAVCVSPQQLDEVPFFREARPRHTAMDNARLRALGIRMSSVEDTVRHAVRRFLSSRTGA